jgi:hypothetical protein
VSCTDTFIHVVTHISYYLRVPQNSHLLDLTIHLYTKYGSTLVRGKNSICTLNLGADISSCGEHKHTHTHHQTNRLYIYISMFTNCVMQMFDMHMCFHTCYISRVYYTMTDIFFQPQYCCFCHLSANSKCVRCSCGKGAGCQIAVLTLHHNMYPTPVSSSSDSHIASSSSIFISLSTMLSSSPKSCRIIASAYKCI